MLRPALPPCRYASYYLTRGSLTYAAPVMVQDPALQLSLPQVGCCRHGSSRMAACAVLFASPSTPSCLSSASHPEIMNADTYSHHQPLTSPRPTSTPQIGAMTSIFPIAYGASKFVSGVLGARFSARLLLAGGLAATALANIAFGCSSALPLFCVLWGVNGMLQVNRPHLLPCHPAWRY